MKSEEIARWEELIQAPIENPNEFLVGGLDCRNGVFRKGFGKDYERGYAAQYQMNEIKAKNHEFKSP